MKSLLNNWDAARMLRLAAGLGIGIFAVVEKEWFLLVLAVWLMLQGLLNISCCGTSCSAQEKNSEKVDLYKEQIKTYKP